MHTHQQFADNEDPDGLRFVRDRHDQQAQVVTRSALHGPAGGLPGASCGDQGWSIRK